MLWVICEYAPVICIWLISVTILFMVSTSVVTREQ